MCLILFAHRVHPDYRLVLAANRDEFFARPTEPFHQWPDVPTIHAGRDSRGGGTWLGVTPDGRWSAVTNFRDGLAPDPAAPSRGDLVIDFLAGDSSPADYIAAIAPSAPRYNGFNLLAGDDDQLVWLSNRGRESEADPRTEEQRLPEGIDRHRWKVVHQLLGPGVYGVSNELLDVPWPKVTRGKERLREILVAGEPPAPDTLLEILLDTSWAAEHELPRTGVPLELERALSATFVALPDYGTRSSSALLIPLEDGEIHFAERRFSAGGRVEGETKAVVGGEAAPNE